MKKKDLATSQDKKDWIDFVKKLENIHDKDHNKGLEQISNTLSILLVCSPESISNIFMLLEIAKL